MSDDKQQQPDGTEQFVPSTFEQQAAAVARAAANQRGHVLNLKVLSEKGKRPSDEYEAQRAWLPHLQDAAKTMARIARQAAKAKEHEGK